MALLDGPVLHASVMNPYMRLKENLPHDSSHRPTESAADRSSDIVNIIY
jgi:hypothetical protein